MRAEKLAARLTAGGIQYDGAGGRSTAGYDELAAYLGRVSEPAFAYALVVYFGDVNERNIRALYRHVLAAVSSGWKQIGAKPTEPEALRRWKDKNVGLIEKLTYLAVAETVRPGLCGGAPEKWRAEQIEVSPRTWRHEYRDRYARIRELLNTWEGEFIGKVTVNQRMLCAQAC